jgi:hypothetical protein
MSTLVSGLYSDQDTAAEAVKALVAAGFKPRDISVVVATRERHHELPAEHKIHIVSGTTIGAGIGAALGAVGLTLGAVGVIAPGVGLLAAGPLFSIIKGAYAGAVVGGLIGSFAGVGYLQDEAEIHAALIQGGAVLVAVHHLQGSAIEAAEKLLEQTGADRIWPRSRAAR